MLRKAWLAGRADLRAEIKNEDASDAKIARQWLAEIDRNPKALRRVDLKQFLGREARRAHAF
jgi:hypothetical protein